MQQLAAQWQNITVRQGRLLPNIFQLNTCNKHFLVELVTCFNYISLDL